MATVTCDDCGEAKEIRSWEDFGPCPCGHTQRPELGERVQWLGKDPGRGEVIGFHRGAATVQLDDGRCLDMSLDYETGEILAPSMWRLAGRAAVESR